MVVSGEEVSITVLAYSRGYALRIADRGENLMGRSER